MIELVLLNNKVTVLQREKRNTFFFYEIDFYLF